jgi:exosortase A-associated hydrolase 1
MDAKSAGHAMSETTFSFPCQGAALVGILHKPAEPKRRGVLMVVGGGPQYRAGGHRQLTLWARRLCQEGYAVMRFDYRGMGDAHGEFRGFEQVDDDIQAALDRLLAEVPRLDEVVLWGECDAASAILFYAYRDARVKAAVLLNPWVRTEAGEAKAILRYYYARRILEPSFWKKVVSLNFDFVGSVKSALRLVRQSRSGAEPAAPSAATSNQRLGARMPRELPLPQRLLMGLTRLNGPVMLVLSGRDLIAREFEVLVSGSATWQAQFAQKPVTRHDFPESDHTFSSATQRNDVMDRALAWLRSW